MQMKMSHSGEVFQRITAKGKEGGNGAYIQTAVPIKGNTELLPDLVHRKMPWVTLLGFTLGVIVMLMVKHFAEKFGQKGLIQSQQPTSLIVILGLDIALDGLLIGLGFAAGQKQGLLLTIALTLEVLF